jgi:hypothetical protein
MSPYYPQAVFSLLASGQRCKQSKNVQNNDCTFVAISAFFSYTLLGIALPKLFFVLIPLLCSIEAVMRHSYMKVSEKHERLISASTTRLKSTCHSNVILLVEDDAGTAQLLVGGEK